MESPEDRSLEPCRPCACLARTTIGWTRLTAGAGMDGDRNNFPRRDPPGKWSMEPSRRTVRLCHLFYQGRLRNADFRNFELEDEPIPVSAVPPRSARRKSTGTPVTRTRPNRNLNRPRAFDPDHVGWGSWLPVAHEAVSDTRTLMIARDSEFVRTTTIYFGHAPVVS